MEVNRYIDYSSLRALLDGIKPHAIYRFDSFSSVLERAGLFLTQRALPDGRIHFDVLGPLGETQTVTDTSQTLVGQRGIFLQEPAEKWENAEYINGFELARIIWATTIRQECGLTQRKVTAIRRIVETLDLMANVAS